MLTLSRAFNKVREEDRCENEKCNAVLSDDVTVFYEEGKRGKCHLFCLDTNCVLEWTVAQQGVYREPE